MNDSGGPGIGRPNPDPGERNDYAVRLVLIDGETLWATTHCVDRFWERAASSETTFRAARARLLVLAGEHGRRVGRPGWIDDDITGEEAWLALSDDVVLLIWGGVATALGVATSIWPTGPSPVWWGGSRSATTSSCFSGGVSR